MLSLKSKRIFDLVNLSSPFFGFIINCVTRVHYPLHYTRFGLQLFAGHLFPLDGHAAGGEKKVAAEWDRRKLRNSAQVAEAWSARWAVSRSCLRHLVCPFIECRSSSFGVFARTHPIVLFSILDSQASRRLSHDSSTL